MSKFFIVYDRRAVQDPDEASVIETSRNRKEATRVAMNHNGVVFEYDESCGILSNGRQIHIGKRHIAKHKRVALLRE